MSSNSLIICKPTSWIKIRGVLIILMFSVFAYLFYTDGSKGYREKNVEYVMHKLITVVVPGEAYTFEGSEEEWRKFAESQKINFPDADACPLPEGFDTGQGWPQILIDRYDVLKKGVNESGVLWEEYSKHKGWEIKPPEELHEQADLNTQFYFFYGCTLISLFTLVWFTRILLTDMRVDDKGFTAPGGKFIGFSAMRCVDKRKWDGKGIAFIDYLDGDVKKRVKVDGMIYGQFNKANGEPAEKLFAKLMDNFKGEVIEFVDEDEGGSDAVVEA